MKGFTTTILMLILFQGAFGQERAIHGTVVDIDTKETLIGVAITVEGTTKGTITDFEGNFSLEVDDANSFLLFTFIGYDQSRVAIKDGSEYLISMHPSTEEIDEVVVTALGIKREKKALGYAVSDVNGQDLTKAKESNVLNSLAGKVAGLQVSGTSGGVNGTSRIILRGESSLNLNNNQPLFVVDGVPISNNIDGSGSAQDQSQITADYGNGASEINPDDIESVSVLKGPAAAALYGSRAANGAIIITTKSGQENKGTSLGVSINSSVNFSSPLKLWDLQTTYGGGWGQSYLSDYGTNYGPKMDGTDIEYDGHPDAPNTAPFEMRFDLMDFFKTGVEYYNNISVSGAGNKGNYRISYTNVDKEGIVPNTDLKRHTVSVNTGINLSPKVKVNAVMNYVKSSSDNLALVGYSGQSVMYNLLWSYLNTDLNWFKDYWKEGMQDIQQDYIFSWGTNPWMIVNENTNGFNKDRIYGNLSGTVSLTDNVNLLLRAGTDYYNDRRQSQRTKSSIWYENGMYSEHHIGFNETNLDFLLSYNNSIGNLSIFASLGGNHMSWSKWETRTQGNRLGVPGVYNIGNIAEMPTLYQWDSSKKMKSVYALANLSYKELLNLDITARNDWSSALTNPVDGANSNNSFFYPSFSLSGLVNEAIDLPKVISFLKIRGSWAEVGNDTDPYMMKKYYEYGTLPTSVKNPSTYSNQNLKPEKTQSVEIGTDMGFFDNRITLDMTYYHNTSKNQILKLPVSLTSGYESKMINTGEIQNFGWEAMLQLTPIRRKNIQWSITSNFSKNDSKVIELVDGLDNYVIGESRGGQTVEARVGGRMGDLYGKVFKRNEEGKVIFNKSGVALMTEEKVKWGNYNPDWTAGIQSDLNYRGFNFGVLFDIRQGGRIVSYTNAVGAESGILAYTMEGRQEGEPYGVLPENAVIAHGDGTYREFTEKDRIPFETFYYTNYYDRSNIESNSFDASYVKLREISLGYTLPKKFVEKLNLTNANISVSGRNIFLWTDVPNIDPETATYDGGTILPGFELVSLPSEKNWGVNLSLSF